MENDAEKRATTGRGDSTDRAEAPEKPSKEHWLDVERLKKLKLGGASAAAAVRSVRESEKLPFPMPWPED